MSGSEFPTIPSGLTDITDDLNDLPIRCIDCAQDFIWTVGEQAFFHDKKLLNPPKRCKECKKAKNRRLEAIDRTRMTGKPHRIEVSARCAKCAAVTTVPFYPSQGRPVYCRSCFQELNGKPGNGTNNGTIL